MLTTNYHGNQFVYLVHVKRILHHSEETREIKKEKPHQLVFNTKWAQISLLTFVCKKDKYLVITVIWERKSHMKNLYVLNVCSRTQPTCNFLYSCYAILFWSGYRLIRIIFVVFLAKRCIFLMQYQFLITHLHQLVLLNLYYYNYFLQSRKWRY